MKKVICILLAVSLMLSLASPVFAEESEEPQYGTLNVEYSDAMGNTEHLDVMMKDNYVYADALALSNRLGYECIQDDDLVSIYANNVFFDQNAPLLAVHFQINESKVSYNPLFGAEFEYTTPAPCIVDDKGVWVPLTYTLVLLGGNSTMLEDTLLVQIPQNNVLSIAAAIVNNEDTLSFDWVSHFGYSEVTTNVTDGAARIVTLFSGLLEFDGTAWLSLIDWDAFDRKFGKSLVTMLCSRSRDELEENTWQVEALLELLSDDGKLGEMLRNKQMRIDSDVTAWQTACENYLKLMEDGSGSPAKYNLLYRQCERAMDQQIQFAALGGEGIIQIQDALSSATNVLDIASIIGEAVSYMTEFQQTDKYLFSVLENYLHRRTETDQLPDATAQSMKHYLRVMDLGTLGYSAYSYIEDNWLNCIIDESGLDALLGAPANALLFTWDIMSETIPFYSEGLKAVNHREISNYAQKIQNDALENLKYLIAELKQASTINAADCVQLSEYCYVYLKACYIARSSAIKSLDNTSEEFRKQIKGKLDVETDINEIIVQYLSLLSGANIENSCYILGFLPGNNEEYLCNCSDAALVNNIKYSNTVADSGDLVTDAYTDAIVDGEWIYCYHIPQVNLSGNCGDAFNAKIYNQFYNLLVSDVYQSMEEYDCPYLSKMVYTWGQKDNLVSIVVQTDQTMYSWTDFYVYTISVDTGEEISYMELLGAYDLSEADFYNLVKETLKKYWDSRKSDMISFVGEDYYHTLVERTIAEENVKNAIPYINSNGELCFVAYVYSAAGAEKYLHLLNTTGTADEGWIECTIDHFAEETQADNSENVDWYRQVLQAHPEATKHSYTSGGEVREYQYDTVYTIYDVDKDGTPELIVQEDLSNYYVYTMSDSGAELCGQFYSSYSDCLYAYDGNGIVVHDGGIGSMRLEHLWLYELSGNVLDSSGYLISTVESTEDALYDQLKQYERITNFVPITDYSLLDNG